jgi:hypothetical protein
MALDRIIHGGQSPRTVEQAQADIDATRALWNAAATRDRAYIVVRHSENGATEFLTADNPLWGARPDALLYSTWRKAHNAAKKHGGLTSPADCYPV